MELELVLRDLADVIPLLITQSKEDPFERWLSEYTRVFRK